MSHFYEDVGPWSQDQKGSVPSALSEWRGSLGWLYVIMLYVHFSIVPVYISGAETEQVTSFRFLLSIIKEKLLWSKHISNLTKKAHEWSNPLAPLQCVKAKCSLGSRWFKPAGISAPTKHMWHRWGICTEPRANQKTTPIPARACSTCCHLADTPVSPPAPQD